ncbi:hypothetical protein [Acidiferrobacter sp.]
MSGEKTKKAAVTCALQKFIARRTQTAAAGSDGGARLGRDMSLP